MRRWSRRRRRRGRCRESYGSVEDEGVKSRGRGRGLVIGGVWVMAEEGDDGDWRSVEEEQVWGRGFRERKSGLSIWGARKRSESGRGLKDRGNE